MRITSKTRQYETDAEYSARIRADLTRSVKEIESQIGHAPRAIMWPYGAYTQPAEDIAKSLGLSATFTLNLPVTFPNRRFGLTGLTAIPRLVMVSNPSPGELDWSLRHLQLRSNVRAVQVDLDYVYDPNPAQQEKNLSALLDRIKSLHPTQVWLQAFADPDGSGCPFLRLFSQSGTSGARGSLRAGGVAITESVRRGSVRMDDIPCLAITR